MVGKTWLASHKLLSCSHLCVVRPIFLIIMLDAGICLILRIVNKIKVHFNKVLRSIFIPTLASITTANTIKPTVYSIVPLKVRIISTRTPIPSVVPMIVVG